MLNFNSRTNKQKNGASKIKFLQWVGYQNGRKNKDNREELNIFNVDDKISEYTDANGSDIWTGRMTAEFPSNPSYIPPGKRSVVQPGKRRSDQFESVTDLLT